MQCTAGGYTMPCTLSLAVASMNRSRKQTFWRQAVSGSHCTKCCVIVIAITMQLLGDLGDHRCSMCSLRAQLCEVIPKVHVNLCSSEAD